MDLVHLNYSHLSLLSREPLLPVYFLPGCFFLKLYLYIISCQVTLRYSLVVYNKYYVIYYRSISHAHNNFTLLSTRVLQLSLFPCPHASASTDRTMFNKGSGRRQPYFVGSMTPNNPCNSASSVFWKPSEEENKREKIKLSISTQGSRWNGAGKWWGRRKALPEGPLVTACLLFPFICHTL